MARASGLGKLVDALAKAAKEAPGEYQALQKRVATRYFVHLDQHAPPDEEGRLRKSFHRVPYEGEQEWIEEYGPTDVEVGTSVYYAPMVNDGHVIGKRAKGHNHGSRKGARRAKGKYEVNKGFVNGTHFAEAALNDLKADLAPMAEDFLADLLKGVGD
jgi:hypothetical protein